MLCKAAIGRLKRLRQISFVFCIVLFSFVCIGSFECFLSCMARSSRMYRSCYMVDRLFDSFRFLCGWFELVGCCRCLAGIGGSSEILLECVLFFVCC